MNKLDDIINGFEDYGKIGHTKKTATQAHVFMIRGLRTNWKWQCMLLCAGKPETNLSDLINQCTDKLTEIGNIGDQGVGNLRGLHTFGHFSGETLHGKGKSGNLFHV